jgi:hypothetical protein
VSLPGKAKAGARAKAKTTSGSETALPYSPSASGPSSSASGAPSGVLVTPPRRGVNRLPADVGTAPSPSTSASIGLAGPLAAAVEKLYGRHVVDLTKVFFA